MLEGWMDEWMCKHVKAEKCMLGFLFFFFFFLDRYRPVNIECIVIWELQSLTESSKPGCVRLFLAKV